MAARQASAMANRSTQRTKRRPDPPVARRPMRQSMAENHSGQMMFDNEFMGGRLSRCSSQATSSFLQLCTQGQVGFQRFVGVNLLVLL